MAKKVKQKTPIKQVGHDDGSILRLGFEVPGIEFRWVQGDARNQMRSWKHWKAVEQDSELGEKVQAGINEGPAGYIGHQPDSNYFHRGDLILAWAHEEDAQRYKKAMGEKASERLRQVIKPGTDLRQTFISSSPKQ